MPVLNSREPDLPRYRTVSGYCRRQRTKGRSRVCSVWCVPMLLSLTAVCAANSAAYAQQGNTDGNHPYLIQPGDVLIVSVWKETDLQQDVLVRPDGGLSFPLVGDIVARGRTVAELTEEVESRIEKYIPDPVVTVSVRQIQGNAIYVIGQVNRPGQYVMNRYVDVVQALSMAGGTTPFAKLNSVRILRRTEGKQSAIPFRYGDVEDGENLEQNIILQPGDVIVVP